MVMRSNRIIVIYNEFNHIYFIHLICNLSLKYSLSVTILSYIWSTILDIKSSDWTLYDDSI